MRILFVLHQFYPEVSGGTERVTLNLARSAQRAGHHVRVLACGLQPDTAGRVSGHVLDFAEQVYHGVPVTKIPYSRLPAAGDFSFEVSKEIVDNLSSWMRQQQFDVAHVLHTMRMGSAILAAQKADLPYVITLTDFFAACYRVNFINQENEACKGAESGATCAKDCQVAPWDAKSLAARHGQAASFLAAAGERVVPSRYVAERLGQSFPGLAFRVIPHGINFLEFATRLRPDARETPRPNVLTLGYLGSIVRQKGLDTLLKAIAKLASPNLRLRIVGGFYGDTTYQNDVRRQIEADSRIEWVGQVPPEKVSEELQAFDLLCLPSRVPETFSLSLNEAAVAGIPALVSDLGAPGEMIRNQGSGIAIPVDDVDAWSAAIDSVLKSRELLETWCRSLVIPYRLEEEAFFYESLYRRLINSEKNLA